jgi:hypothetical protein
MPINLSNNILTQSGFTNNGDYADRIIRDGLTVYLDSMNINSYPGSGTVWYDLSYNGNNGTMVNMNSPSASNTSGFDTNTKYMMFDRHVGTSNTDVNNYISITNSDSLDQCLCQNGMTIEMWYRETSYYTSVLSKWDGSWEFYYNPTLYFRTQGTGSNDWNTTLSNSSGTWRQHVFTHDGRTRRYYINGVQSGENFNQISGQNTSNVVSIGAYYNGYYACYGALPIYRLYNRVLHPYEIAVNFQANRGRFGL